jgi:hypothetical protein
MTVEEEIRDLKASLLETRIGAVSLLVCVVQSLAEVDPTLRERVASNLRQWHGRAANRARPEARQMAEMFGQALVDPAFPMSSDPPKTEL